MDAVWEELGRAISWCVWWAALPTVVLTKAEFDALLEYSRSMPTGVFPNKRWKRCEWEDTWLLGEYLLSDTHPDTHCKTVWSMIEVQG